MNESELITQLRNAIEEHLQEYLHQQPMRELLSVDQMEALTRTLLSSRALHPFDGRAFGAPDTRQPKGEWGTPQIRWGAEAIGDERHISCEDGGRPLAWRC